MPRNSAIERSDAQAQNVEDATGVHSGQPLSGDDHSKVIKPTRARQKGQNRRGEEDKEIKEKEEQEGREKETEHAQKSRYDAIKNATIYHWDLAPNAEKERLGLSKKPDFDTKITQIGTFYLAEIVEKSRLKNQPDSQGWHEPVIDISRDLALFKLGTFYWNRVQQREAERDNASPRNNTGTTTATTKGSD
ncbi:hypothetical protein BDV96DRAFT_638198 [Lophiotrema nucula]|uniref:Uncharacterized protein n=1 Tax=Lophiotrema nucula TaxID=690887 RepID=A0A6A5YHN7_9PLEO|nr:hypothetical protein BDV96DRAFT_638198 [Lophiotrema nucula]